MKFNYVLLTLFITSLALAECNTSSPGGSCTSNADCPGPGVIEVTEWFYPSGAPFCDATCHLHTPTVGHPLTWVNSGICTLGVCMGSSSVDMSLYLPAADCVAGSCGSGACTAFGAWTNTGCGLHSCGAGQMSQKRSGTLPACCSSPDQYQCVTDAINCPVVPSCGPGHICGNVHATENPTQALPNIGIEVRDGNGVVKKFITTDTLGHFDLTLPAGNYFVSAIPDRLWNATPGTVSVSPDNPIGSADFLMHGVPARVVVNGPVGAFVLITPYSYTGTNPPAIGAINNFSVIAYSRSIDKMIPPGAIKIPGGYTYWLKCWKPVTVGQAKIEWIGGLSQPINGGAIIWPLDNITEACL